MRSWFLTTLVSVVLIFVSSSHIDAEDMSDFETLDAALTLWEFGLVEKRADLAIASLEVVADIAPFGAEQWVSHAIAEVRLLALGAPDILERADSLSVGDEMPAIALVLPQFASHTVRLPEQVLLGQVRTPLGWRLKKAQEQDGRVCKLNLDRITDCREHNLSGEITFSWSKRAPWGVIAYAVVPMPNADANQ
ncbi:MAG: hypothetical protein AAF922_13155 [Pseudomonadota bacterium]